MKLKPCPFCGGEAKVIQLYPSWVACERCGARITAWTNKSEDSIDAWNRRQNDTDIVEAVKQAIRELCEEEKGDKTETECSWTVTLPATDDMKAAFRNGAVYSMIAQVVKFEERPDETYNYVNLKVKLVPNSELSLAKMLECFKDE